MFFLGQSNLMHNIWKLIMRLDALSVRAKQQISICCETLCEKNVVEEYIAELEARIRFLENDFFKVMKARVPVVERKGD